MCFRGLYNLVQEQCPVILLLLRAYCTALQEFNAFV
jgi:hypothetical protein